MSLSTPSKDYLTCITCRVAFKDGAFQRMHYKTDWHQYNLKRKVADFPPVSAEEFQRRVYNLRNANELDKQDKSVYCEVCHKSFGNPNAFNNHLNSKKHKENEKNNSKEPGNDFKSRKSSENSGSAAPRKNSNTDSDSEMEVEEVDSDEWDESTENPIDNNDCIFCSHHSNNFIKNLEHMTIVHSFFIPDIEYCTDVKNLLKYLGEKVCEGFMCIWCNEKGKTFHSAESAKQHMVDKGHCKMIHEGIALAEYADFYDYSSSYPDANEDVDADEEVSIPELDGNDYQLVLPSGAVIGHRSLMKYYKQSINPNRVVAIPSKNDRKLHKVLAHYRALGWTETEQAAVAKKVRDLHFMKRVHAKHNMRMGVKANKLQKHFRPQVPF